MAVGAAPMFSYKQMCYRIGTLRCERGTLMILITCSATTECWFVNGFYMALSVSYFSSYSSSRTIKIDFYSKTIKIGEKATCFYLCCLCP